MQTWLQTHPLPTPPPPSDLEAVGCFLLLLGLCACQSPRLKCFSLLGALEHQTLLSVVHCVSPTHPGPAPVFHPEAPSPVRTQPPSWPSVSLLPASWCLSHCHDPVHGSLPSKCEHLKSWDHLTLGQSPWPMANSALWSQGPS